MKVEFKNVYKRYGQVTAVCDLNLVIDSGAFHFLLGPSGCGKTTTLRLLAGLEAVSDGQILFNDRDVTHVKSSDRKIGMVFQNYALWPHMSVQENIEYGLKLRKLSKVEMRKRVAAVVAITQLHGLEKRLPGQLSGGQQQRVALARALAIRPAVLLLDEPLSNLDAKLRTEMRDNITRIHRETQITTLYVTHDQKEALSMGSKVTVMKDGFEMQTGSPRELFDAPNSTFLAGFIGETNIIAGTFKHPIADRQQALVDTPLGPIVTKYKGSFRSGDAVSLSIRPCDITVGTEDNQGTSAANNFTLPLECSTYLGEVEQLNLQTSFAKPIKVNVYHPHSAWSPGRKILCRVDPEHVVLLPTDT